MVWERLGNLIENINERNTDLKVSLLLGVNLDKKFFPSIANIIGTDLSTYKIVRKGQFACKLMSVGRDGVLPLGFLEDYDEAIVSGAYYAFKVKDETIILPQYLMLCMSRKEFDRELWFRSGGDVRGGTSWEELCSIKIPVPTLEEQQQIVNSYKSIEERIKLKKQINDNLAAQMRAYFKEYTANNASITGKLKDYSVMQYGYTETATTEPVGPKFLRITDIAQNYIDWNGVPYCPISEGNHEKYVLSEGDVVVARTGATVGYAKMVGRNIPDSVFASFLVRIRPIDDEYRYYFGLAITSSEFLDFVQTNAGGSAQPQANPPLLGEFELSIPNKQSLPEFNTKISSFLGVIESNETEISKLHEVKDTMVKMLSSR